jgi:lia operon protein LiaG
MKRKPAKRSTVVRSVVLMVLGSALWIGCSESTEPFEETQSFTGIAKLAVDGSFFEVEVIGHAQDSVETEVTIPDRIRRRGVTVSRQKSGSTLEVSVEGRRVGSGFLSFEQPRIKIKAPFDTEIVVETSSGSIAVEAIATRSIDLSSSSGGIGILDCEAALSAKSSSGKIDIDSTVGPKDLSSSSGNMLVQDSDGDIDANSSSGRQTYEGVNGSINATSTSGKIDLTESDGTLELQSTSGNLHGSDVTLRGDSSLQTSSGTIDVDFTNDLEELTLDLESSSGKISAGRTSAKGTVVAGSGSIHVHGKSSSGRQTYK